MRVLRSVFLSLLLPLSYFPFERRGLQTFYYCESCAAQARAATRHGRIVDVFCSFPVQFVLVLAPIVPVIWFAGSVLGLEPVPALLIYIALVIPIVIFLGRWIDEAWLRRAMRRYPQRPDQAAWGHAVYWASPYPRMNWDGGYHAARPEWIRALVEANPHGVSDETYREWMG